MNAALAQLASALDQDIAPSREHLTRLAAQLWQPEAGTLDSADIDELARRYRKLDASDALRHHLLRALAASGSSAALATFAQLFVEDPPGKPDEAALSCVPLLQRPTPQMTALFPRLLDALQRPVTAALVLDIANHLTVRGIFDEHPAKSHLADLVALLGGLVEGLRRLEEDPRKVAGNAAELQRQIADSVALIAPLCEALALIGDSAAIGKLRQVLSLSHRRLRVTAASALARLNEPAGIDALVELAAEPVVRSQALAALENCGERDRVEPRYRSATARAEGELAAWLAHPSRFGLPPSELDLIDASCLSWPGYEEPVECFLFQYEYVLPQGEISGVGIAGPITHALYADLEDLPPDDIYAVYAGWSVEHAEISETPAEAIDANLADAWRASQPEMSERGYHDAQLVKIGHFFGDDAFVATARHANQAGVLILEEGSTNWFPVPASQRPLGPTEIYWLFLGRRILRAFHQ